MMLKGLVNSVVSATRKLKSTSIRNVGKIIVENQISTMTMRYRTPLILSTATGVCIYALYDNNNYIVYAEVNSKERLVILGSGWASVSLIKSLNPNKYDITVISPTNYFLYTPLLPSVTVGTVDARSLVEPIRKIINKKHKNDVCYVQAECKDVNVDKKIIHCKDTSDVTGDTTDFEVPYDILVVAVGSQTATYGDKDIEKYAHRLKNVEQARQVRKNVMDAFETAAIPGQTDEEMRRLLNFVVVGGGPTGVEFAGELRDFVHNLKKLYPAQLIEKVSVTLVNSHYKVLSMYDQEISDFTEKRFKSNDINVIGGCYVVGIDDRQIKVKNKKTKVITEMPYGMCVWAAGIAPRAITKSMITKIPGQRNRNALITDGYLRVRNAKDVFGIGDCATVEFTKLIHQVEALFKEADKDGSGELCMEEFSIFIETAMKKFPEMTQHLCEVQKGIKKTFAIIDTDHNQLLSFDEFKSFLTNVDNELKSYPATAQVAAQQGKYLGNLLNLNPMISEQEEIQGKPFMYSHLGNFAYVGGERAVLQLPVVGSLTGWATMWLWRAAYLNQAVSWRMSFLIGLDWVKTHVFGRDTSRI